LQSGGQRQPWGLLLLLDGPRLTGMPSRLLLSLLAQLSQFGA
jgi:hypothetical protein